MALSAVVLTGCQLDARVRLEVNEDGSGTSLLEVAIDDELLDFAQSFGVLDIDQLIGALGVSDTNGEVTERREGDTTIYTTTSAFTLVSDLEDIVASFGAVDVGEINLVVDDDGTTFSGRLDPPDFSATLGGVGLIDPSQLSEAASLNLEVLLPGEVGENDADQTLADGTLRWVINLDGPTEMSAVSSFGGGGFPAWLVAVIAALVVAIGGFLALGRNRDGGAVAAVAGAPTPDAPMNFDDA